MTDVNRILIVDDNEDHRSTVAELLARNGYQVSVSANGVEALKAQSKAPFDVLITDIFMPDKDGIEIIDEFHKKHPRTRIIAMSGVATNGVDYLLLSLEIGAHKVLRKPFDAAELKTALKEVLAMGDRHDKAPGISGPGAKPANQSWKFALSTLVRDGSVR